MNKNTHTEDEVLEWARKEMLFSGPLKAGNLKRLCRGNMLNIWKFLMRHVRSEKTVREIRSNIFLNGKAAQSAGLTSSQHAELAARRNASLSKATEARQNYQKLRVEVEQLKNDINVAGMEQQSIRRRIDDSQFRVTLLDSFASRVAATRRILEEYERRLLMNVDQAKKALDRHVHTGNAAYFAGLNAMDLDTSLDPALTPAMVREISSMVDSLRQKLHSKALKGDGDLKLSRTDKRAIWDKLSDKNYHPSDLIGSLTALSHQNRLELKKTYESVDLLRDARMLRYRYEHGSGFVDLSQDSLGGLVQLLQKQQEQHIEKHMMTERLLNMTHEKEDVLLGLMNAASRDSSRKLKSDDTSINREVLVQWLLDSELLVKTEQSSLAVLEENLVYYREELRRAANALESLKEKHRQIQYNSKRETIGDQLISRLLRRSGALRRQHGVMLEEMKKFVNMNVKPFETVLHDDCSSLQNIVSSELDGFRNIDLERMLYLPTSTTANRSLLPPVCDLAISRACHFDPVSPLGSLWTVVHAPLSSSADTLLPHILDLRQRARLDFAELSHMSKARETALENPLITKYGSEEYLASLLDLVSKCESYEKEELAGELKQASARLHTALEYCNSVNVAAEDWWSQGGQYTLPEMTVEGKSLLQWQALFRSLSVQLSGDSQ